MDLSRIKNLRDANEITRAYMESLLVESRYLDACEPDLSMELYGKRFASPVMIAAFSHLQHTHPGGMAEMAKGAYEAGICNWAGMGPEEELEDILATGAETVKIVKPYADRDKMRRQISHADAAGALAIGIDIDHSFSSSGHNDVVLGEEMRPVTSRELSEFVSATKKPFIIKGVLSVEDAVKCAEAGVKGLLISHHHGVLPYGIPPLMALPEIKKATSGALDLFVDCGIDTGYDAFKCLALGAKAVCVGRAILPAFKEKGAQGVKEYIEGMNNELRCMMAKTCSKDTGHIARGVLWDSETGTRIQ